MVRAVFSGFGWVYEAFTTQRRAASVDTVGHCIDLRPDVGAFFGGCHGASGRFLQCFRK